MVILAPPHPKEGGPGWCLFLHMGAAVFHLDPSEPGTWYWVNAESKAFWTPPRCHQVAGGSYGVGNAGLSSGQRKEMWGGWGVPDEGAPWWGRSRKPQRAQELGAGWPLGWGWPVPPHSGSSQNGGLARGCHRPQQTLHPTCHSPRPCGPAQPSPTTPPHGLQHCVLSQTPSPHAQVALTGSTATSVMALYYLAWP